MGDEPRPLINERVAAERLNVSPRFLQARRLSGGGPPFIKIGRSVRYRLADLETWIAEREFESTAQY